MSSITNHCILRKLVSALLVVAYCNAFVLQPRATVSRSERRLLTTRQQCPFPAKFHSSQITTLQRRPRIESARSLGLGTLDGPVAQGLEALFSSTGNVPLYLAFCINALGFMLLRSKLSTMLTKEGFISAIFLGTSLWATLGWRGWTVCVVYLFLGQMVTKVKFKEKKAMGIAEGRGGRRGPENVWGSAATGLACAICASQGPSFLGISSDLFLLGYVASLATKIADTFASEIGKAYGKTTFLITTFERVEPGTEGAVSAEGTAAAAVGGLLLSLYGWSVGMIGTPAIAISTVAAFLATNVESLLGATLQEKEGLEWLSNEVINFINTMIGAALAIAGGKLFLNMV